MTFSEGSGSPVPHWCRYRLVPGSGDPSLSESVSQDSFVLVSGDSGLVSLLCRFLDMIWLFSVPLLQPLFRTLTRVDSVGLLQFYLGVVALARPPHLGPILAPRVLDAL
jgi:hypothetical protein